MLSYSKKSRFTRNAEKHFFFFNGQITRGQGIEKIKRKWILGAVSCFSCRGSDALGETRPRQPAWGRQHSNLTACGWTSKLGAAPSASDSTRLTKLVFQDLQPSLSRPVPPWRIFLPANGSCTCVNLPREAMIYTRPQSPLPARSLGSQSPPNPDFLKHAVRV